MNEKLEALKKFKPNFKLVIIFRAYKAQIISLLSFDIYQREVSEDVEPSITLLRITKNVVDEMNNPFMM
jgi:hypothetical protein